MIQDVKKVVLAESHHLPHLDLHLMLTAPSRFAHMIALFAGTTLPATLLHPQGNHLPPFPFFVRPFPDRKYEDPLKIGAPCLVILGCVCVCVAVYLASDIAVLPLPLVSEYRKKRELACNTGRRALGAHSGLVRSLFLSPRGE